MRKNAPGFTVADARPEAIDKHFLWPGDQGQVGQFLYGFQSAWLPDNLLEEDRQSDLADALFSSSRQWQISLHFNKGLAGAPPEGFGQAPLARVLERVEGRPDGARERAAPFELEERPRDSGGKPQRDPARSLELRLEGRPAAGTEVVALDATTDAGWRQRQVECSVERPFHRHPQATCHRPIMPGRA